MHGIRDRARSYRHPAPSGCGTIGTEEDRWPSASAPDGGRPVHAGRCGRARRRLLRPPARSGRPGTARRLRDIGSPRVGIQQRLQRGPHRGRRPRRSAATARRRAPTARCSSAATRTPCRSPRSRRRSRCWRRTVSTSGSTPPTATPRHPSISHAILVHNRGRSERLADGIVVTPSHNPPEDGGFKYNPPNGGPADTDVTGWIQAEANRLLEADLAGVRRIALADAGASTTPYDFVGTYVADLASVIDMDAIRSSGLRIGVDPLGGASVAYWPAIGERYGLDLTVTNDDGRPAVRVHDLRLGRADPDGPVVAPCDGPPRRVEGPLRRRPRQRHRRRPPRDRHAGRGPPQPEPLPRGRGRPPVRRRPRLGRAGRRRQDARLERDDRPGDGRPRPPPARGPGRVQVVRRGAGGRQPRVRRRGERRRLVPPSRRDGLDDRQGRHHRLPPGGRDHGPRRPGPRRGLRRPDRPVRGTRLSPDRRARHARPEGRPGAPVAGGGVGHRRSPAIRSRRSSRPPRATAPRSAGSRS